MSTSVPSRPAPGADAARLVVVPPLRGRPTGPTPTVCARPDADGPAAVLVRALPHAGRSARIGVPGVVHAALLALVAGQCVVLDVSGHGVPAGAALLVVALSGALLLRYGVARPVVPVRHAVPHAEEEPSASATVTPLRPARGERATGEPAPLRPPAPPPSRTAELDRIRRAVLAVGSRRSDTGARWCYGPAGAVVACTVAPVLVWSVLVATAPAPALVDDPAVATAEQQGTRVAAPVSGLPDTGLHALRRDPAALVGRDGPSTGVRTRTDALGSVVPGPVSHQLLRRPAVPTVAATAGVTATSHALVVRGLLSRMVVTA